jgi:hypothetical protein
MLAIDDSASIFCARLMRGTMSIAMTVAPLASAQLQQRLVLGGPEERSGSGPARAALASAVRSAHLDHHIGGVDHRPRSVFKTSTPAAV